MTSMTGYADRKFELYDNVYLITIKSWNNRYQEISVQLPSAFAALERDLRQLLEKSIQRGKLECSIRPAGMVAGEQASMLARIKSLAGILRDCASECGISAELTLADLIAAETVFKAETVLDTEQAWSMLEPEMLACLEQFSLDRKREGLITFADISSKLDVLDCSCRRITDLAPAADQSMKESLRQKYLEVLGELVDENRILSEIALYLAKYTINEELVRFQAHLAAFRSAMSEPACAKRLDFISQELNREANTIGSKSALAEISHLVIDMKEAIENIREQLRNIE